MKRGISFFLKMKGVKRNLLWLEVKDSLRRKHFLAKKLQKKGKENQISTLNRSSSPQEQGYSNIKDIYIEIRDYTYFHNPSRPGQVDERFIGRELLIDRIRALLTSSETSSGAYLITGFRGMGKSSLISKVLDSVGPKKINLNLLSRIFRSAFFLLVFASLINAGFISSVGKDESHLQILSIYAILIIPLALIFVLLSPKRLIELKRNPKFYIIFFCSFSLISSILFWISSAKLEIVFSNSNNLKLYFIWILIVCITAAIIDNSRINDDLKRFKKYNNKVILIKFVGKLLLSVVPIREKYAKANSFYFFQDFNICLWSFFLIVHMESLFQYFSITISSLFGWFAALASLMLVIILISVSLIMIYRYIKNLKINGKLERGDFWEIIVRLFSFVRILIYRLYVKIKEVFNYSGRINLRINLGHDSLKEIDILRLIAKSTYESYKDVNKLVWHFPLGFLNSAVFLSLVLFVSTVLYDSSNAYHHEIKRSTYFIYFFPSQDHIRINQQNYGVGLPSLDYSIKNARQNVVLINSHFDPIIDLCIYLDLSIQNFYQQNVNNSGSNNIIDYFYIIYIIIVYSLIRYVSSFGLLGYPTHRQIKKRLSELYDRVQAQVHKESSSAAGRRSRFLSLIKSEKKVYPIADVREVESELLRIFEMIQKVPRIFNKIELVFVFDELDKIEANHNATISDKEDEENAFYSTGEFVSSEEDTRRRRRAVANILANLKHFFTTAQAKFIFIAGRELYDASLADISDRNYFLGSIFNDVIYVNSFLIDDEVDDVSSWLKDKENHTFYDNTLIEKYVCNYLIPENVFVGHSRSLKTYYKYCKYSFGEDIYSEHDNWINLENRSTTYYIICVLRKFIIYLSYRSNGSPKKLTFLLEKYLRVVNRNHLNKEEEQNRAIVFGKNSRNFFLHFTSNDLYTFGLINYLTTPYLYQIARNIQRYNDKLRVSTSFILDHIFKHHNSGFSWRNLELTPEIIDINKAPILRVIIRDIISYLQSTQLETVLSGLYDYKFNKRITNEFIYLSKINESESAAFNFTLDESQEIKRHYYRKLYQLNRKYDNPQKEDNTRFINSISFIQGSLGDLHYYDQEYDDAIVSYKDAIQVLRETEDILPFDQIVVYTRLMLKLSLALEKKRSYSSSLQILDKLGNQISDRFKVELEEIGLEEVFRNSRKRAIVRKYENSDIVELSKDEREKYYGWPNIEAYYKKREFDLPEYILGLPSTSEYSKLVSIVQSISSIRLLLQPFIAKLHIKEKEKIGGITEFDIAQFDRELDFMLVLVPKKEKKLIKAEYHNKLGDLLFFKNSVKNDGCYAIEYYQLALKEIVGNEGSKELNFESIIGFIQTGYTNSIYIERKEISSADSIAFRILGNTLGDLGDSYFTHSTGQRNEGDAVVTHNCLKNEDLRNVLESINELLKDETYLQDVAKIKDLSCYQYYKLIESDQDLSYTQRVIKCCILYALSSKVYLLNNEPKKSSSQLLKILYLLEDSTNNLSMDQLKNIEDSVLKKYFDLNYLTYDSSSRAEFEKFKQLFKWTDPDDYKIQTITSSLPVYTELQEGLAIFYMMAIGNKDFRHKKHDDLQNIVSFQAGSIFSRILTLILKARYNYKRILDIAEIDDYKFLEDRLKGLIRHGDYLALSNIAKNITDGIYCCTEVLISYKSMDVNRSTPYSTLARTYHKRAWWIDLKNFFLEILTGKTTFNTLSDQDVSRLKDILNEDLRRLVGPNSMSKLKVKYNGDQARHNYLRCLEVHEGKEAYSEIGSDMYYLDDDYNDEHYHFHTALERNRIGTNRLIKNFNKLELCIQGKEDLFKYRTKNLEKDRISKLYMLESYF